MATHELPEWEAPTQTTRKSNIWRKSNPFLLTPTIDRAHSYFSRKLSRKTSPLESPALDKEAGEETPAETATTADEISPVPRWCGFPRRICIVIIISIIVLIALIVGLAVGLGHKSHSQQAQDLPLPSNTGIFTGDLTYYSPGPGYGACGYQNNSQEAICAISHFVWDADLAGLTDGNDNPLCGKRIRITRFDESVGANRSVDVEVVDRCVGCAATDLDLSSTMFDSLADQALGRVVGSWAWLT